MKKKYFHLTILLILFTTIVTICSYRYFYLKDLEKTSIASMSNSNTNHEEKTKEQISIEPNENIVEQLQQENNNTDIKAVLSIDNSPIKEPVAQTTDNDYYLTHDYKKQSDKLGAIYADYRVNLEAGHKILIFGHSSTKKNTPFNYLENYYDESFYDEHKYITLETQNNIYRYEIFSVYVETNDFTYMNLNFNSNKDWYLHILKLQSKSVYKTDVDLSTDDDIMILQTCSTNKKYKNNSKKYLLIVSRRVKE